LDSIKAIGNYIAMTNNFFWKLLGKMINQVDGLLKLGKIGNI
jgi:hypothetical protein